MKIDTDKYAKAERSKQSSKKRKEKDSMNIGLALSTSKLVEDYGSASAEYIKGYTGVDNELGSKLAKGLKDISKGKLHPDYTEQNFKQQAGYSAEVAATSRDNADAIIKGSRIRTSRSDDLAQYGKNHQVVDRVQILDGNIVEGTQSQMKFVGDHKQLFKDITKPDGKFARYRGVKLELPSEQYEGAAEYCRKQAGELRENAARAESNGKHKAANQLREQADNYELLAKDVRDSGLTTEDAIFYRKNPKLATIRDIGKTSHQAGIEGAKYGLLIGAIISLLQNSTSFVNEEKNLSEAALDLTVDTGKATLIGYGTASAGSALKAGFQQSGNSTLRGLSRTSAPVLIVSTCISLGSSIKSYIVGDISEAELLEEVGEKGAGMLSSGMMAAVGQLAIPIPLVGAVIGGMIGYTLSSFFYQSALDSAKSVELSRKQLLRVKEIERVARERILIEQKAFDAFIHKEIPALHKETQTLFQEILNENKDIDSFAAAVNQYATLLGSKLQLQTRTEFEDFMTTDKPLTL